MGFYLDLHGFGCDQIDDFVSFWNDKNGWQVVNVWCAFAACPQGAQLSKG